MSLTGVRAGGAAAVDDGALASFHGCTAVALIAADGSGAAGGGDTQCAGLALQLTEDAVLMGEEIPDQTVAVALVHGETALGARSENAWGQDLGERSNVLLIGRGQINQTCEVSHDGIKRGNVGETKLSKRTLQDLDSSLFRGLVSSCGINGFDDFVDLRRNKRV